MLPSDAATEPFKSDSQRRLNETTKACGQEAEDMMFQCGHKHEDKIITVFNSNKD